MSSFGPIERSFSLFGGVKKIQVVESLHFIGGLIFALFPSAGCFVANSPNLTAVFDEIFLINGCA